MISDVNWLFKLGLYHYISLINKYNYLYGNTKWNESNEALIFYNRIIHISLLFVYIDKGKSMDKMKIDIWSDIACPYCYIGKRKLEMALDRFPQKDNVELIWHSYELDPDLPKESLESKIYGYFSMKYGVSVNEAHETMNNTAALAKEVGLNFDYDNLIVANTSDALRMVKLANESNLGTEAEEILFDAYFVKGEDVSDRKTLLKLGTRIGLKENEIISMLDGDKYLADIKKDIEYSENELNLQYIPFYLFNNREMVEGSVPVEDYLDILTRSYAEWEESGVSTEKEKGGIISGQSCSIDGVCS